MREVVTGPRNDPNADWAPIQGDYPDDLHGNTRGKCYAFKDDGRCPECLVEACERQQAGGFARELGRRTVFEGLVLGPLLPPANRYPGYAFDEGWTYSWTLIVHESGH